MKKKFTLIPMLFLFSIMVYSQQVTVTGKVIDQSTKSPLSGASVKSVKKSTVTDQQGSFSLQAVVGETLNFSYIGMLEVTVKVNKVNTGLLIEMVPISNELDQLIVVGYKSEKKKDLTGAVSVINVKEALKESNANILTSLQGRVPGIQIESDGTPGGGSTSIRIRGFSTTGSNGPLFVIDGVPTTYSGALNPSDIESIQVLKDAASASIYGARANNGVIVITTKKGKDGKAKVTFNASYGSQTNRKKLGMLNAQEWGNVYWQAEKNSGITPSHPQYGSGATPVLPQFIDAPNNTIPAGNTNWQDVIFKSSQDQAYNVGVSQASGKSNYYLGVSYNKDDGIERYTGYERFSTRLNSNFNISDKVTIGENLMISNFNENKGTESGHNSLYDAILQHPLVPVYDLLGNFGGPTGALGDKLNPLGELYRNRDNKSNNWRIFGNVYLEAALAKGLTFRSSFGVDDNSYYLKAFTPRFTDGRFNVQDNYLTITQTSGLSWTWSNIINYHLNYRNHTFEILGGIEAIKNNSNAFSSNAQDFLVDDYKYVTLSNGTVTGSNSSGTENALLSQFGKLNYNYSDRYLFSATVRRDGSSRFGPVNQYGVFPAFSGGWRISNESFFPKTKMINDLKLRGSWGKTGNQEIGDFNTLNFYKTSAEFANYDITGSNTSAAVAFYATQLGNNQLKWEAQTQTDFGLDLLAFNNRLTASVDYYRKETSDMLLNPVLLAVYGGANPPYVNSGKVENKGIEIGLGFKNAQKSELHYSIDFNIAFNKNKVISLANGVPVLYGANANEITPGQPMSVFYGYVSDGIFKSDAEVNNSIAQPGKGVGRIRYKDVNNDKIIDANDRTFIGDPNPKFLYGLNFTVDYKGLDASVFISGVSGNKIYNQIKTLTDFAYFPFNFGKSTLNAWSPSNPNSGIPSVNVNNPNDELRNSSYYVENGGYLKIKSIQIGYTLPRALSSKVGIERARFYVQGQNLFTFTKYTGIDPEIGAGGAFNEGVDAQFYPHPRAINFGLNINF